MYIVRGHAIFLTEEPRLRQLFSENPITLFMAPYLISFAAKALSWTSYPFDLSVCTLTDVFSDLWYVCSMPFPPWHVVRPTCDLCPLRRVTGETASLAYRRQLIISEHLCSLSGLNFDLYWQVAYLTFVWLSCLYKCWAWFLLSPMPYAPSRSFRVNPGNILPSAQNPFVSFRT